MPFIKVMPVQDRISFVNVDDIQSIAMGGPEDTNEGPCFVLTFRNGQSLVCRQVPPAKASGLCLY
jgi:hypothetical protein